MEIPKQFEHTEWYVKKKYPEGWLFCKIGDEGNIFLNLEQLYSLGYISKSTCASFGRTKSSAPQSIEIPFPGGRSLSMSRSSDSHKQDCKSEIKSHSLPDESYMDRILGHKQD